MTTAVQSSELVFEFASNGMDEINQTERELKARFRPNLLNLLQRGRQVLFHPEVYYCGETTLA